MYPTVGLNEATIENIFENKKTYDIAQGPN